MVLFGEELFPHVLDKFEVFPRELGPELGFEYEFNLYDALEGRLWCPLLILFGVLGLDRIVSKWGVPMSVLGIKLTWNSSVPVDAKGPFSFGRPYVSSLLRPLIVRVAFALWGLLPVLTGRLLEALRALAIEVTVCAVIVVLGPWIEGTAVVAIERTGAVSVVAFKGVREEESGVSSGAIVAVAAAVAGLSSSSSVPRRSHDFIEFDRAVFFTIFRGLLILLFSKWSIPVPISTPISKGKTVEFVFPPVLDTVLILLLFNLFPLVVFILIFFLLSILSLLRIGLDSV